MHSSIEKLFAISLLAGFFSSLFLFLSGGKAKFRLFRWFGFLKAHRRKRIQPKSISPVLPGLFLTIFGATGLVAFQLFRWPALYSFLFSFSCAAILSGFSMRFTSWFFSETAAELTGGYLPGTTARVTLSIPEGGVGVIACVIHGKRVSFPARSRSNGALEKDQSVMIVDFVNRVALVEEL